MVYIHFFRKVLVILGYFQYFLNSPFRGFPFLIKNHMISVKGGERKWILERLADLLRQKERKRN